MIQRILFRTFLFFIAGIFSFGTAAAQWQRTGALQSGALQGRQVSAFAASGANIFTATIGGVFRSSDSGVNWTETDSGITNVNVTSLAVSGTKIFVGTIGGGVFLTTNNGASWHAAGLNGIDVRSLLTKHDTLYAGTGSEGVQRTTDGGTTWAPYGALTSAFVYALATNDTLIYAGTSDGLYKINTTINGDQWKAPYSNLPVSRVNSLAMVDSFLYIGSSINIYILDIYFNVQLITLNAPIGGQVYAVTGSPDLANITIAIGTSSDGVFHSSDSGRTWVTLNNGLFDTDVHALYTSGNLWLAGTNSGGVFRSTNNGAVWNTSGHANTFTYSVAACRSNIIAGTDKGIFTSTDNGTSWAQELPANNSGMFLAVHDSLVYAAQNNGVIYRSTDAGMDWTLTNNGLGSRISCLAVQDTTLFAGTTGRGQLSFFGGVLTSIDSGVLWGPTLSTSDSTIYSLFVRDSLLFAGGQNGIFISSNEGNSWDGASTSSIDRPFTALGAGGTSLFAGTDTDGVFTSTDNGKDWSAASGGLTNKQILALEGNNSNIYACTNGGGIYTTVANSVSWSAINTGLPDSVIPSMTMNSADLYVALGGNGVWRRPLSQVQTSVNSQRDLLPQECALSQNYPNPFSITSDITFSVNDPALYGKTISVSLYNTKGRTLETLYRGTADAGEHTLHIDGAALPAGNYFYSVECNGRTLQKEMTVVR